MDLKDVLNPMEPEAGPAPGSTSKTGVSKDGEESKDMQQLDTALSQAGPSNPAPEAPTEAATGDPLQSMTENMSETLIDTWGMEVDSSSSNGDADSAIGTEIQSSTISIRESVYRYHEENGRTYHAFNSGKYMLPNDDAEQERLDLQHHLFLLTLDGQLHLAPLSKDLHNVLDIGTGTGIWATEFAEQYPGASVLGTDLSPIQPLYVPPNCRFEVNDAEEPWDYSQHFDYIHGRAMLSCFRDPKWVVQQAFSILKPGGYFEYQDPCMPIHCLDDTMRGTALERWTTIVPEAAAKLGRSVTNSKNYGKYMEEAGFVDIVEKRFFWPLSSWPRGRKEKLIALWSQQNLLDGINAMSMAMLTRAFGWTKEQAELLLVDVRKDIKNKHIHAYIDVVIFYGRKPE